MGYPQSANVSAYQNMGTHGGVAAANPHGLILLLMNGAIERIAKARGCIVNQSYAEKSQLLHRAVAIIDELRNSLQLKTGNAIAANLDTLYDYMCRQLMKANLDNSTKTLDEVLALLHQIRDAWQQIPKDVQGSAR
jgi:flagellar protein FliS